MRRIAIIGCGGSGKSTLARRMGELLSLPVYHLDRLFWRPGWVETPTDEWRSKQRGLVAEPRWIIDGNFGATMDIRIERAVTVVFLDMPTWTCLSGAFRRFLRHRGTTRPELVPGCPERLTIEYLAWIWRYRMRRRPGIRARLEAAEATKTVVVLSTRSSVTEYLQRLSERAS